MSKKATNTSALLQNSDNLYIVAEAMTRYLNPFLFVLTSILAASYAYVAWRLSSLLGVQLLLAVPFILVWLIPVLYWIGERDRHSLFDQVLHFAGYVSMGWLSFVMLLTAARDVALGVSLLLDLDDVVRVLREDGGAGVLLLTLLCLGLGALRALQGPVIREVVIPCDDLHPDLDQLRIVQISDLHVGPTIHRRYVEKVTAMTNALSPDMVVLTGDIVDGPVADLADQVAPLAQITTTAARYFIVGNHEYYSAAGPWIKHFDTMGFKPLLNTHVIFERGAARLLVAGVLDPASKMEDPQAKPDPATALRAPADAQDATRVESPDSSHFKLLLAHNPKIASEAARAGFDLQLSGHTHAGQFFPWTIVTRLVHAPHFFGLSRRDQMWVYVSAGTGTWGPPVRFGTRPELTLIRLKRSHFDSFSKN